MKKSDKERVVGELAERLKASPTLIVADYRGLTMPQIDALRGELLVRAPVRPRLLRLTHLLERHRQIEMRVGIERVEAERLAVARLRFGKTSEIVVDVAEVEVRVASD